MTSPSWKSHPITRWSIRLPNRHDLPVGATLIALSAWFAPSGWAEDAAAPKPATALDVLRQQNAALRWERAKAQNESAESSSPTKTKSRPGLILPLPEDDIASGRGDLKLAPVLPDSPEEPRWVIPARPVPEPIEAFPNTTEISAQSIPPQSIRAPQDSAAAVPPGFVESTSPRALVAVAQDTTTNPTPIAPPSELTTKPLSGPRKLRTIQEISPYYDTTVDKDIRDFALQRAKDYNVAFAAQTFHPREFPDTMYAWEPANFYNYPLYFEDPALERYGHTRHPLVQPFASVARFGTQLVMLPYQMTIDPPTREVYALGYYRPGDCAPKLKYPVPLNAEAAAVEVGVWTGLFFLVP